MLARQGVVTLIDIGGRDCVEIVKKLIVPIKARPAEYPPSLWSARRALFFDAVGESWFTLSSR